MSEEKTLPRRIRLERLCQAELAILDAQRAGADTLLTEAVVLLQNARGKVADYVDKVAGSQPGEEPPG